MRLIDIDKILDKQLAIKDDKLEKYWAFTKGIVYSEPKVDAIPVEWIKKWVEKNTSDPINATWNTYTLHTLEGMIYDWENENE